MGLICNPYKGEPIFRLKRDSIDQQVEDLEDNVRWNERQQMYVEVCRAINAWYYEGGYGQ